MEPIQHQDALTSPVILWDNWFDGPNVTDDFLAPGFCHP